MATVGHRVRKGSHRFMDTNHPRAQEVMLIGMYILPDRVLSVRQRTKPG
jgi:hypothetical protein